MSDYIEGRWYWVTDGKVSWPALRHSRASGGWSNLDTWEDFDGSVTDAELIDLPRRVPDPQEVI